MARKTPPNRLEQLVEHATRVFVEQGYRRTQIADVAAAMGVAKGTIYLCVESKEALFDLVRGNPTEKKLVFVHSRETLSYVADRLEQAGVIPGPAEIVRLQGGQAYVVLGRTFTVFDVTNPSAPRRAGTYTFPDKTWGVKEVGSLVYAAGDKFGLANPDVPTADGGNSGTGSATGSVMRRDRPPAVAGRASGGIPCWGARRRRSSVRACGRT